MVEGSSEEDEVMPREAGRTHLRNETVVSKNKRERERERERGVRISNN